ncbi:MAG: biopolymer transporter ExbD [Bacteriovoracia bacterium]
MKRTFKRRKAPELVDLDITSLLDILVILLVFLLMNYNASDLSLDLVKNLEMADSESQRITHFAPVVQLNGEYVIFLDQKEISRLPAGEAEALTALETALKERHEQLPEKERKSEAGALINLVFDRETDYVKIEKIMASSAKVGFTQFKFIVKGTN